MTTNYEKALNLLTSSNKFRISLGLDRMEKILDLLGNPQDKMDFIHIAGTNGKGSVCAILSSILTCAGKKTGLFTSPHIFKYTERIKINETEISDEDFSKYVFEILKLADENNIDLTEFEILTTVMFKYFYDNKVEIAILETGMGGRFDATNVIKKHLCSAITHIDLDHTERLGDTKDKIAHEKAGIMKPNCPCIVLEGYEVFYDYADKIGAMLEVIYPFADTTSLNLKGTYQKENLSLALAVIEKTFPEISQKTVNFALGKVKHFGRFQYIKSQNLIIDGAHNPNGIKLLKESLDYYFPNDKRRFFFGCLNNKDYKKMLSILFRDDDEIYFYKFHHANSCDYETLKNSIPYTSKKLNQNSEVNFNDGKLNIICGSLYMISEILKLLKIKDFN